MNKVESRYSKSYTFGKKNGEMYLAEGITPQLNWNLEEHANRVDYYFDHADKINFGYTENTREGLNERYASLKGFVEGFLSVAPDFRDVRSDWGLELPASPEALSKDGWVK